MVSFAYRPDSTSTSPILMVLSKVVFLPLFLLSFVMNFPSHWLPICTPRECFLCAFFRTSSSLSSCLSGILSKLPVLHASSRLRMSQNLPPLTGSLGRLSLSLSIYWSLILGYPFPFLERPLPADQIEGCAFYRLRLL